MQEVFVAVWEELKIALVATPIIIVAAIFMSLLCSLAFKRIKNWYED
jgi:hypothetical protein